MKSAFLGVGVTVCITVACGAGAKSFEEIVNVPAEPRIEMRLPDVRLTPPVTEVAGLDHFTFSLDGTWDFIKDVPDEFNPGDTEGLAWSEVENRRHFAHQGHGRMHRELGVPVAYRKSFDVPADWDGRYIALRFGSLDGQSEVWINGQRVGGSDLSYLPVEFDATPFLEPGQTNEVVLTLARSYVTHWHGRDMGGLLRSIDLVALPPVHLSRLHVETKVAEDRSATASVRLAVHNAGDVPVDDAVIHLTLVGPEGETSELGAVSLPESVPASGDVEWVTPFDVEDVELWHTETPRTYTLRARLLLGEDEAMVAERRFGFRQITIDGPRFLLNGRPFKAFGAVHHLTYPGYDHAVPADKLRTDLDLLKSVNVNFTRPFPAPARAYVDHANEVGVAMTVETGLGGMIYWKGLLGDYGNNDDAMREPFAMIVATMLEAFRSDPAVLVWGLANESPYYGYYADAAAALQKADPTRPVIHCGDLWSGVDKPELAVNDEHYPRNGVVDESVPGRITGEGWDALPRDKPFLSSEWCHAHRTNMNEVLLDPGVDDYWGWYVAAHADYTREHEFVVGGCMFAGAPVTSLHAYHPWGLFDDHRRMKTIAWHVRKAYSPIALPKLRVAPIEFEAVIPVENRFAWRNLDELELHWIQGRRSGTARVSADPGKVGRAVLPFDPNAGSAYELEFREADGALVDRFRVQTDLTDAVFAAADQPAPPDARVEVKSDDGVIELSCPAGRVLIDAERGLIREMVAGDSTVATGGPRLLVRRSAMDSWARGGTFDGQPTNVPTGWEAEAVNVVEDGNAVRVEVTGRYEQAAGGFVYTLTPDGSLRVNYDFAWLADEDVIAFEAGLQLDVPAALDTVRWQRHAQWSTYPEHHIGRAVGEASAHGDPRWRSKRDEVGQRGPFPWPHAQDLVHGITRDFGSTKTRVIEAELVSGDGAGIAFEGGGEQAVRVDAADNGFHFNLIDFYSGGTEIHLMKSVKRGALTVESGTRLRGEATFRLITGAHGRD